MIWNAKGKEKKMLPDIRVIKHIVAQRDEDWS